MSQAMTDGANDMRALALKYRPRCKSCGRVIPWVAGERAGRVYCRPSDGPWCSRVGAALRLWSALMPDADGDGGLPWGADPALALAVGKQLDRWSKRILRAGGHLK